MTASDLTDEASRDAALREEALREEASHEEALRARIHQEMADSLDEELELELDDIRLDQLEHDGGGEPSIDRKFYFRVPKIAAIVGEMVTQPDMMKRRLREGVEFFQFLRERRSAAA